MGTPFLWLALRQQEGAGAPPATAVSPNPLYAVFGRSGRLCDNLLENPARDVSETEITSLEPGGQARVVQAEQAQHGGVKIVDVHAVARR